MQHVANVLTYITNLVWPRYNIRTVARDSAAVVLPGWAQVCYVEIGQARVQQESRFDRRMNLEISLSDFPEAYAMVLFFPT